jgi:hypothetical protein
MHKWFIVLLAWSVCPCLVYGQEAELKSTKAKAAVRDYERKIEDVDEDFEKQLKNLEKSYQMKSQILRARLLSNLNAAMEEEAKRVRLEEANEIKELIKQRKEAKLPTLDQLKWKAAKKPLVPDGVYRADYGHYPWVFEYHVKGSRVSCPEVHNDDGHSEPRNWRGKLRPLGENRVAVNWVHGIVPVLEIWTITDSHILIQQWTGNDDRSKLPTHLAVIWLDKK